MLSVRDLTRIPTSSPHLCIPYVLEAPLPRQQRVFNETMMRRQLCTQPIAAQLLHGDLHHRGYPVCTLKNKPHSHAERALTVTESSCPRCSQSKPCLQHPLPGAASQPNFPGAVLTCASHMCLRPHCHGSSRFLTRKEETMMRRRLCTQPSLHSCRIAASTRGYPVCPFFQALKRVCVWKQGCANSRAGVVCQCMMQTLRRTCSDSNRVESR